MVYVKALEEYIHWKTSNEVRWTQRKAHTSLLSPLKQVLLKVEVSER